MTAAFRYAEASIVVPIEYTGIVHATLLGYVLFGEIPGVSIWLGVPLVIGAGLLIIWREYRPPLGLDLTTNGESCARSTHARVR